MARVLDYKAARRKAASLINGVLLPRLGIKVIRSRPKSFRYRKNGSADGRSRVSIAGGGRSVDVELREGTSDWMTFDQIFIDEDYDMRALPRFAELSRLYEKMSRRGAPLIIDLGANIGLSALYFSMIWPKARIVAVEPDAENFELLRRNVAAASNIDTIEAAAASKPGKLRIVDPDAPKNAVRTAADGQGNGVEVDALTIRDLLDRYIPQGCIPFIIKIDIEGAESELFSANVEWIDEFPLMVVELHDWLLPRERTSQNFLRAVSERDRDFVYVDENIFSIKNHQSDLRP